MPASAMEDQARWNRSAGSLKIQPRHHLLIDAAQITPGMRVLDVASGRGETAVLAARAGAQVHATDVGSALVQAARDNAARAGVTITVSVADMRNLDDIGTGYDRVIGCAALHHLDESGCRAAVAAAVRLLAPDGRALFLEPVANVPWFEFLKCCFPGPKQRPSILNRPAWRHWLETRDDRWMSDGGLLALWPKARIVKRFGLFRRIAPHPLLERVDAWLLARGYLARFAQAAIIEYQATANRDSNEHDIMQDNFGLVSETRT